MGNDVQKAQAYDAAEHGDVALLRQISAQFHGSQPIMRLVRIMPIGVRQPDLVMHAARHGQRDVVLALIDYAAEPDTIPVELCDYFCDVGSQTVNGASLGGHVELLKELLEVHHQVRFGSSISTSACAVYAARGGHVNVLEYLVGRSGSVELLRTPAMLRDTTGMEGTASTPALEAASHGHVQVLEYLLAKVPDHVRARQVIVHMMHEAAKEGHVNVLEFLLQHQLVDVSELVDRGVSDSKGHLCVHLAAQAGHVHVLRFLVEIGGRSDVLELCCTLDRSNSTPALLAARAGHLHVLEYLVANAPSGARVISSLREEINGARPLQEAVFSAAKSGNLALLRFLCETGLDLGESTAVPMLDVVRKGDRTSLSHVAIRHRHVLEYLVARSPSKSAILRVKNGGQGYTPAHFAMDFDDTTPAIELIVEHCGYDTFLSDCDHRKESPLLRGIRRGKFSPVVSIFRMLPPQMLVDWLDRDDAWAKHMRSSFPPDNVAALLVICPHAAGPLVQNSMFNVEDLRKSLRKMELHCVHECFSWVAEETMMEDALLLVMLSVVVQHSQVLFNVL